MRSARVSLEPASDNDRFITMGDMDDALAGFGIDDIPTSVGIVEQLPSVSDFEPPHFSLVNQAGRKVNFLGTVRLCQVNTLIGTNRACSPFVARAIRLFSEDSYANFPLVRDRS